MIRRRKLETASKVPATPGYCFYPISLLLLVVFPRVILHASDADRLLVFAVAWVGVLAHECGHVFAATRFGNRVRHWRALESMPFFVEM